MSEAFTQQYPKANAPDDVIYVADRNLDVIWTNHAWADFASANRGHKLLEPGQRVNLLQSMAGSDAVRWAMLYDRLLTGALPQYEEVFICPSPDLRRQYRLRVTPLRDQRGAVQQLVHHTQLLDASPAGQKDRCSRRTRYEAFGADADLVPAGRGRGEAAALQRTINHRGGDFIWMRRLDSRRRVFVLGDVMGHDLRAAIVARRVLQLLEEQPHLSPGQTVRELNNNLCQWLEDMNCDPIFATGIYLLLDNKTKRLTVANFAHHGVLFSRAGLIEPQGGLPIGLMRASDDWPEATWNFVDLGRRLLAFTDGVIEQFNPDGQMFGLEGVLDNFSRTLTLGMQDCLLRVALEVDRYRRDAMPKDDQTLLGVDLS